jgi:hypothetical protein
VGTIEVSFDDSAATKLRIPVKATVRGDLQLTPEVVQLGSAKNGYYVHAQRVRIASASGQAFRVLDVQRPDGVSGGAPATDEPTPTHYLNFDFPAPRAVRLPAYITVVTDHPRDKQIRIALAAVP